MKYALYSLLFVTLYSAFLIGLLSLGRRIGIKHSKVDSKKSTAGISQVEGTILALLGLMIAFSFYGASQRFDNRRQMIVNEANAIGTAWLRIDLLPTTQQSKMRELFKNYVDARLKTTTLLPDIDASKKEMQVARKIESKIWDEAMVSVSQSTNPVVTIAFVQALNNMFDTVAAHNITFVTHTPLTVYLTLFLLLGCSCFFLGYSLAEGKKTAWFHGIGYIVIMIIVLYVIIDFEFPRAGFLTIELYDQPMLDLKESIFTQ